MPWRSPTSTDMTLAEQRRDAIFHWTVLALLFVSVGVVALARPHLPQPQPTAASSAARG